jgi:hypothetical protein
MPTTSGNHNGAKSDTKSAGAKSAGAKAPASGKQGGSHDQHVKAGEQSHKNSK